MEDCIFCKIANHEIESSIFYEDDDVVAFDDLNPQAPVHCLVVPKKHHDDIGDDVSAKELGAIFSAVPKVAAIKGLDKRGYRMIVNTGADAGQTVRHLHVHVIGGKTMAEKMIAD